MPQSVGGATIKRMTLTKAWGLSPASASIEAVGAGVFSPGSSVALNIGASVFHGVVGDCVERITDQGRFLSITVPDNRIKLMWDTVYGSFNTVEILEDDVSTPGIDRKKRYVHVYPEDWDAQKKTRTNDPHSALDILQMLVGAPTVDNGWGIGGHGRLENPVYGVDASRGKKLGTIIQEIIDQVGLIMTLNGSNSLIFAVKGGDSAPSPSSGNSTDISDGSALGPDTKVRIVGDRNLYQDLPIDLEPDWNPLFEELWYEPRLIEKVKTVSGGSSDGEAAARARVITVRELGDAYADRGLWGEVARMEMTVWQYVHDIVYKAYRVPRGYTVGGLDLDSLELRDGLLAEVESNSGGALSYKVSNFYPDTKGFCVIQGQTLMRFDPKFLDSLTADNLDNWRSLWQPNNHFNFDSKNKTIIFEDVIFKDAGGAGALVIFPNRNIDGVSDEVRNIAVPNANAVITAAPVRASLCFAAEVYSKFFGSGFRTGAVYVSGLNYHALSSFGSFGNEIPYINGKGADQIAAEAGAAALTGENFLQSGGFTRIGVAGMLLNGSIDRITVQLQFEGGSDRDGISETVEYAKERAPGHFESERELERRGRIPDALKKIREQEETAAQIRFTAKHLKPIKRQSERPYQNLNHFAQTPVGAPHGGTQTFSSGDTWLAGQPVFVNTAGIPTQDGKIFRGIVIADKSTGPSIATATQGTVPVRVKGPFATGDDIGIDTGSGQTAKKGGALPLGKVNASYSGSGIVTVPVRLGAGSGAGGTKTPFLVYESFDNSEPPYPVLKVYPGRIAGVVPKIGAAPLDQQPLPVTPQPWLYTPGVEFKIYLKCMIDLTDPLIAYRSHVKEVLVKMSTEADVIADAALLAPIGIRDGSLIWTGDSPEEIAQKNKGHFYLLVATVFGAVSEGNIIVNGITQWLFSSYRTFAVTDSEAIALA